MFQKTDRAYEKEQEDKDIATAAAETKKKATKEAKAISQAAKAREQHKLVRALKNKPGMFSTSYYTSLVCNLLLNFYVSKFFLN